MVTGGEFRIEENEHDSYDYYYTVTSSKLVIENEKFTSEKDGKEFRAVHIEHYSETNENIEVVFRNCVFKNLTFLFDFFSDNHSSRYADVIFENCIIFSTEVNSGLLFSSDSEHSMSPRCYKFENTVVRNPYSIFFPGSCDLCIVKNSRIEIIGNNSFCSSIDFRGNTVIFIDSELILPGVRQIFIPSDGTGIFLINSTTHPVHSRKIYPEKEKYKLVLL